MVWERRQKWRIGEEKREKERKGSEEEEKRREGKKALLATEQSVVSDVRIMLYNMQVVQDYITLCHHIVWIITYRHQGLLHREGCRRFCAS